LTKKKKIILFASLLLVAYIALQVIQYFSYAYETEVALSFEVDDSTKISGVFIRDEEIINTPYSENVHYLLNDGNKVSNYYEVAEVFSSVNDSDLQIKINQLSAQKSVLLESQDAGALASYDVDLVSKQINQFYGDIYDMSVTGNLDNLSELKDNLLIYLNRRRISLGIENSYNEKIFAIQSEISSLKNSIRTAPKKIYSPSSGYFVSGTDGYENLISVSDFGDKSYDELFALTTGNVSGEEKNKYIGKIITDYTWYYAFPATSAVSERLKIGNSIDVKFSFNGDENTEMTIHNIVYDDTKENAVIILSCDIMSEYISSARYYDADLIFKNYKGLKIARTAERILNGERGVYIKLGNQIKFKKLDVLYENEDYLITKISTDNSYVRLYDEVVVEGKDLYNGKHIN
jgi:hypothetical protein